MTLGVVESVPTDVINQRNENRNPGILNKNYVVGFIRKFFIFSQIQ